MHYIILENSLVRFQGFSSKFFYNEIFKILTFNELFCLFFAAGKQIQFYIILQGNMFGFDIFPSLN